MKSKKGPDYTIAENEIISPMDYIYAKLNYEVKESPDYTIAENEIISSENLHEYHLLKDEVAVGDTIVIPNTLQEAKDYTYSKVEIDNKDTAVLTEAKEYTDILGIVVEQNKQDIEDGTTVFKKAEQDQFR